MSFQWPIQWLKSSKSPISKSNTGSSGIVNLLDKRDGPKDVARNERLRHYHGWVYGVTTLVANNIACTPLRLYAPTVEGKKVANFPTAMPSMRQAKALSGKFNNPLVRLTSHPALDLLNVVNDYLDGFGLLSVTQLQLDLLGDCYWYVEKDTTGVPVNIHVLDPQRVSILTDKRETKILGYMYRSTGTATDWVEFATDEVVRFSNASPSGSKFYGDSPIRALASPINKIHLANRLEESVLRNNGMPTMLLKSESELTPEEIRLLETQFLKATSNGRQGGVKCLDKRFSLEPISLKLSELMLNEQTAWDLKSIALAYQVPYGMVDTTNQLKAGLDQFLPMLARNCLAPRFAKIEQALNQQYAPMFDGRIVFSFDSPLPDDDLATSVVVDRYVKAGVMTPNEARGVIGLPPIDGGDELGKATVASPADEPARPTEEMGGDA